MPNFVMIQLTDNVTAGPVWINPHQVCAMKAAAGVTEIHTPGGVFRCTEPLTEILQLIADTLNGNPNA